MHVKAVTILASTDSTAAASELTKYSIAAVTPACLWNQRSFRCTYGMQRSLLATMQVHMDVKSPNVLLGRNNLAKLADVGLAKFLHKDYLSVAKSVGTFAWSVSPSDNFVSWPAGAAHASTRAATHAGWTSWHCLVVDMFRLLTRCVIRRQAPEVLMGSRCSEKVDIFSLGVVLWELVTGKPTSTRSVHCRPILLGREGQRMTVVLFGPLQARARHGDASDPSSTLQLLLPQNTNCNILDAEHGYP